MTEEQACQNFVSDNADSKTTDDCHQLTRFLSDKMEAPGRVELPTNGLGNRCSIHLSYGADAT